MDEINSDKIAELEALLFYYGEPIALKKIAGFLNLSEGECEKLIKELKTEYQNNSRRGLTILFQEKRIQLATKEIFRSLGQKLSEEEFRQELSPASLETLAIIAYFGPMPRSIIDYIRGVNSSFTLRSLLMRGLVDRETNSEKGNIYQYQISFEFLKHMGLEKISDLPEYEKYKEALKRFEFQV